MGEIKAVDREILDGIIRERGSEASSIIAILQAVQERWRYLPREAFAHIAARLGVGEARIYSVATFYENFSLEPKGKYVVRVCDGTACHVRKSVPMLERLRAKLRLSAGEATTGDMLFTVETVSCLGACGLAPALTVNGKVHAAMTPDRAEALLDELLEGERAPKEGEPAPKKSERAPEEGEPAPKFERGRP